MKKIKWDQEEAVALLDLYFQHKSLPIPKAEVQRLSVALKLRAKKLGIFADEKFRNIAGLNMQLACIHYVVTDGNEGLSNCSKLFYDTYDLYMHHPEIFSKMLAQFKQKYPY